MSTARRHDFEAMRTRLFVSTTLINASELELQGDRARYLGRVLRLKIGDMIGVFDGSGSEWPAEIVAMSKNSATLLLGDGVVTDTESPLHIHLVQGVSRGERMDFVVQKSTELGVHRISPVLTDYGVVKLDERRANSRLEHWQAVAASAAEQCGRSVLPVIDPPVPLKHWFGARTDTADIDLILRPGGSATLANIATPASACLLIGPEGGFSDVEYDDAEVAGFTTLSMGPRILRTETAAAAALAALQTRWGDLG